MDSGILSRVLDDIREYGGDFVIEEFDVGHEAHDPSSARITVEAPDDESLQRLLMRLQTRGVNQLDPRRRRGRDRRAGRRAARRVLRHHQPRDAGAPRRAGGTTWRTPRWTAAWSSRSRPTATARVRTVPMSDVARGMRIVVGAAGIQVTVPELRTLGRGDQPRSARTTDRSARRRCWCARWPTGCGRHGPTGKRLLWVAGPGVVHAGGVPAMVALVRAGWVDVLFAGNAVAALDIETALYGASLGSSCPARARARSRAPGPGGQHHPQGRLDRARGARRRARRAA